MLSRLDLDGLLTALLPAPLLLLLEGRGRTGAESPLLLRGRLLAPRLVGGDLLLLVILLAGKLLHLLRLGGELHAHLLGRHAEVGDSQLVRERRRESVLLDSM